MASNEPMIVIELIPPTGVLPSELDEQRRNMMRELEENGVQASTVDAGASPGGAKGEALALGTIAATLITALVPRLVAVLEGWVSRRENRKLQVKLADGATLTITGPISAKQTNELVARLTDASKRPLRSP